MPPLLMTMPSAPLIIPLTALIVAVSVFILLLYYYLKRAIGCPHKTSTYRTSHPHLRKSVLPSSPYEINERESTASPSSSIFFNQSGKAALLYPALASAPSPSSQHQYEHQHHADYEHDDAAQNNEDYDAELPVVGTPDVVRTGNLILMESRSASVSPGRDNQESPMPYEEVHESVSYRAQMSYQRTENQFVTFDASVEPHFESDV